MSKDRKFPPIQRFCDQAWRQRSQSADRAADQHRKGNVAFLGVGGRQRFTDTVSNGRGREKRMILTQKLFPERRNLVVGKGCGNIILKFAKQEFCAILCP